MKYIRQNRFWIITGLETFVLGLLFSLENHFIDQPPHMPSYVGLVDDQPFAIFLMIVGFYVTASSLTGHLDEATRSIIIFVLTVIWTFYFIVFLVHDTYGPFAIPRYTTIVTGMIVLRILGESLWGNWHIERHH